jgi:putative acetyltransferase
LIEIRDERPDDIDAIRALNRDAFGQELEGRIVDALREHGVGVLSLVGVSDGTLVGHIMFSPATIGSIVGNALGPMAVRPAFQRQGIGSQLVARGLDRLRTAACSFVVVIGHPDFYRRFGFRPAAHYGLTCDWDVPAEAFMVQVLEPDSGAELAGRVAYRPEFSMAE